MNWIKDWIFDEIRIDKRLESLRAKTDNLDRDCQMLLSYLQENNENGETTKLQGMLIVIRSSLNFANVEIQNALQALNK